MKFIDSVLNHIVCGVITFLEQTVYCPKIFFEDEKQKKAFAERPSILVSNHTSHLDGGFVNVTFHKNTVHALAAKDRFEKGLIGFLLRHTGCIPIDREHADTSWIHESLRVLHQEGGCISIYPEGRHGTHRCQRPFHPGVIMLAAMAGVPLIMIYIDGPHKMFHRTKIMVGKPFMLEAPSAGLTPEFIEKQTALLQEKMKDLMNLLISKVEK